MQRLYRSKRDRILAGFCAGLGAYFDIDPAIIRLGWVALTLISFGIGVIVYILAWIIVVEEPGNDGRNLPGGIGEEPAAASNGTTRNKGIQ